MQANLANEYTSGLATTPHISIRIINQFPSEQDASGYVLLLTHDCRTHRSIDCVITLENSCCHEDFGWRQILREQYQASFVQI